MPARSTAADVDQARVGSMAATQSIKLGLNKSVVIDLPADAYDILVANPAVADAVTRTARRIYLFGKTVGETNIFVFGPDGEQIVSLDLAGRARHGRPRGIHQALHPDFGHQCRNHQRQHRADRHRATRRSTPTARRRLANMLRQGRRSDDRPVFADGGGGSDGGGVDIDNPDSAAPGRGIVNLIADHRRRPGHAEGHRRRSQPQRHEAAQRQPDGRRLVQRHQLGRDQRQRRRGSASRSSLRQASIGSVGTTVIDAYFKAMEQAGVMRTLAEPTLDGGVGRDRRRSGSAANSTCSAASAAANRRQRDGHASTTSRRSNMASVSSSSRWCSRPGRISLKIAHVGLGAHQRVARSLSPAAVRRPTVNMLSIRRRLADTTRRASLRRIDGDRRPCPGRRPPGGPACPACRSCRCSARCSAAATSCATRPSSSSS